MATRAGHLGPTVFRSTDGGASWSEATRPPAFAGPMPSGRVRTVDQVFWLSPGHASEPDVWYAGTAPEGLFRSEDSGVTWGDEDDIWAACATPGTLVDPDTGKRIVLRFELTEPLPKKTGSPPPGATAVFTASVPSGYITGGGTPFIENCADAGFGNGAPFVEECTTTLVQGTNSIGDLVWQDEDSDGAQDGGTDEPGINGVTVKLYWDENGNGTIDEDEPQINAETVDVIDGKLDLDGNGTADDNGEFDAYDVIAGRIDVDGDGDTDADDDGTGLIGGYDVIDGYLDMDDDGGAPPDTGDDGKVTGTMTQSKGATIADGVVTVPSSAAVIAPSPLTSTRPPIRS